MHSVLVLLYATAFSLYWGLLVYRRILEMLEAQTLSSSASGIPGRTNGAQYYCLLAAHIFFLTSVVLIPPRVKVADLHSTRDST